MIEHGQGKLLPAALAAYIVVFGLFAFFEQPGLGIGHGFYVPIVVAAMATGSIGGIIAGVVATVLYALGVIVNPDVPPSELTAPSSPPTRRSSLRSRGRDPRARCQY